MVILLEIVVFSGDFERDYSSNISYFFTRGRERGILEDKREKVKKSKEKLIFSVRICQ